MNNNFVNWKKTAQTETVADAGGEYILPNDLPDVKKILHIFTSLKENGTFFESPGVTADAEISYTVSYTGDDGKLHIVKYNSPVTARSQTGAGGDAETVYAEFSSPDTQIRLSNPRKFQIRSRAPAVFYAYAKEENTPYIEGTQDAGLQCCEKNGVTYSVQTAREDSVPYSTDVRIPDSCPEPEYIMSTYAVPSIPTVMPSEGTAEISFTLDMLFLYASSDGGVTSYKSSVEISHELAADGIKPDSVCRGKVCINDLTGDLTTDKNGEMRIVEVDLTYSAEIMYETAENGTYVADMYSTEYESTETYKDMELRRAEPVFNTHFTVSGSAEGEFNGDVVFATASCDKIQLSEEDTGAVVTGETEVYVVTCSGGEYEGHTVKIPVRAVLQYGIKENGEYHTNVTVGFPSVRVDGGTMYADVELYVSVSRTDHENVTSLAAMTISDIPVKKEKASVRLYRADENESEWDTAKKYKVSLEELQKANAGNNKKIYIIP